MDENLINHFIKRQEISSKVKNYDFTTIDSFKKKKNTIQQSNLNVNRVLLFKVDNSIVVDEKYMIYIEEYFSLFIIFSIDDDNYILKSVYESKKSSYIILAVYSDYIIENLNNPKAWVRFWQKHFKYHCKEITDEQLNDLLNYLCFSVREFINLAPVVKKEQNGLNANLIFFSYKKNRKKLLSDEEFSQIIVDTANIMFDLNTVENFNDNLSLINYLNCPFVDWSDALDFTMNKNERKEFNIIIRTQNNKIAKNYLYQLITSAIIIGLFENESLFIPGENIMKDILDIEISDLTEDKSKEYLEIVLREYKYILLYIIKQTSKKLL